MWSPSHNMALYYHAIVLWIGEYRCEDWKAYIVLNYLKYIWTNGELIKNDTWGHTFDVHKNGHF